MFYLDVESPQYPYQGMQKYLVIGLMNIYWSKTSDNTITNIICIIL